MKFDKIHGNSLKTLTSGEISKKSEALYSKVLRKKNLENLHLLISIEVIHL